MSEQTTLHAIVHGRVQGVGFRWFVQGEATRLGLTGWVRNLADGTVEVEATGTRSTLETLLTLLREGPRMSRVDNVDFRWQNSTSQRRTFSIQ